MMARVAMIDLAAGLVFMDDGAQVPVTDWLDADGEDCAPEHAVQIVAGSVPLRSGGGGRLARHRPFGLCAGGAAMSVDRGSLAPRLALALDLIEAAANGGRDCPKNDVIAGRCGLQSVGAASAVVKALEKQGLIRVERGNCGRVVTIAATGARTAGAIGAPHWRFRDGEAAAKRAPAVRRAPAAVEAPPEPMLVADARLAAQAQRALLRIDASLAGEIEREARRLRLPVEQLLARCLWLGFQCHVDDFAAEAA